MQKLLHFVPTIAGAPVLCSEWEENKKKMWPMLKETQCFKYLKIAQIHSIASTTYSNYKAD